MGLEAKINSKYYGVRSFPSGRSYQSEISENGEYIFEEYDENFKLSRISERDFSVDDIKGEDFLGLDLFDGTLCVISSSSTEKALVFYRQKVSLETLLPEEHFVEIHKMEDPRMENLGIGTPEIRFSPDGDVRAIMHPYNDDYPDEQYEIVVFDKDWNPIYTRLDFTGYKAKLTDLVDWQVLNSGEINMVLKHHHGKRDAGFKGNPKCHYTVRSFFDGESDAKSVKIKLSTRFLGPMNFRTGPNKQLYLAANVEEFQELTPKKLFCARISAGKDSLLNMTFLNLPEDSIAKDYRNGANAFKAYGRPRIQFGDNAGIYFTSQRSVKKVRDGREHFLYNGIIVSRMDQELSSGWSTFVFKEQVSYGDNGQHSSYGSYVSENDLHLFYTTIDSTVKVSFGFPMYNVTHNRLNSEGEVFQEHIFHAKDLDAFPRFKQTKVLDPNHLVVPVDSRKEFSFMLMNLKVEVDDEMKNKEQKE